MSARPRRRARGLVAATTLATALGVAACGENFITGPRQADVSLRLRNWSDTLVLGERRPVGVMVVDGLGREVLGATVRWTVAAPEVLEARRDTLVAASDLSTVSTAAEADDVHLAARHTGTVDLLLTLDDGRFAAQALPVRATVVAAGVQLLGARDTTVTAIGDTAVLRASAYGRQGAAALVAMAGEGVTWTRRGTGAVTLLGTGDSVRTVATATGTDTLVATHALCLAGARCADTVVVHVEENTASLASSATDYRLWSLGDSAAPQGTVQDGRGNAIPGARLVATPVGTVDSAIVRESDAGAAPASPATQGTHGSFALVAAADGAGALLTAPPLVARANGTARVALRAIAADGRVLDSAVVEVVVRQVARSVRVAPAEAELTPGDSIPVLVEARDARGHLIADASFPATMAGAVYRNGRIVVPAGAPAGTGVLHASVVGIAAPSSHPLALVGDPAPDSARVIVRVPQPMVAGDTTSTASNVLAVTVFGADGRPAAGVWVRFSVPAGSLALGDSVLTDANGLARARWTLPTTVGSYTATAFVPGAGTASDSAGQIVLRRTTTVIPAAPTVLAIVGAPGATASLGAAIEPALAVQLRDAYGNDVRQAGVPVTVAADSAAGFTLGGTLIVSTDSLGVARFATLAGDGAVAVRTLHVTATVAGAGELTPAASAPISFTGGAPSATASTAVLSPATIVAGDSATLVVTPRDERGSSLGAGQSVIVTLPAGSGAATVSTVTDLGDGRYRVTIVGLLPNAGVPMAVSVDGTPLATTPSLAITAGPVAQLALTAGNAQTGTVGAVLAAELVVTATDARGNPVAGVPVTFTLPAGAGSLSSATGVTAADGTARTSWTLGAATGAQSLAVASSALPGTTLAASATAQPGAPSALTSTSTATGSTTGGDGSVVTTVVIRLLDGYGNPTGASAGPLTVNATGGGTLSAVTDNGDGTYTVVVTTPAGAAATTLVPVIGGANAAQPLVVAGVAALVSYSASTLTLSQSTLLANGTAATTVTVRLTDTGGQPFTRSGGTLVLATTGGTLSAVTDNGDGTYTAVLTAPTALGAAVVSGTLAGTALTDTAAVAFVAGAPVAAGTTVSVGAPSVVVGGSSTVTVRLEDAHGNPVAGAASAVTLGTTLGTLGTLVDNGDGSYTATLTAGTSAGTATVTATVAGQGTTATLPVLPSTPSLTQSTVAAGLTTVVAGGTTTIVVRLEDAYGNALTSSGGVVVLSTTGGTLSAVTDNGDGSYTAVLTAPATPGAVTVSGTLGGSAITQTATVTVVVGPPSAATSTLAIGDNAFVVGESATVTVVVRDAAGNVVTAAASGDVALATTLGTLGAVTCAAGSCTATYTATTAGSASISATIGGTAIVGSPIAATVTAPLATTPAVATRVLDATAAYPAFTPVTAAGGTAPYSYALGGGTLPAGMSFDPATGAISGTATAVLATTTFSVTVTDGAGATSAASFDLTVNAALATTQAVPSTVLGVGDAYTPFAPVTASGGTAPLQFTLGGGTLPAGMTFSTATGQVSGTATESLAATTFTVTVTDAIGVSTSATFDLAVNGPPTAPTLTGVASGDGQLTVAFTAPPTDGGSAVTNYEYSLDGGDTWTARAPASAAAPLVVTGLANGTTYQLTLRAVNAAGAGLASATLAGTPAAAPGAPAITGITAGSSQLTVAFTAPASDGGAAITNYEYSTNGGASWTTRAPAATTSPLVIAGLTNGTTYSVRLRALNVAGTGTASGTTLGTPATTAGAPTTLTATAGLASATLAWSAPADNGGASVTDYRVEYRVSGAGSWSTFAHAASSATSIAVTGLTNGTTYQFQVAAVNAVGTGAPSAVATATPGAPGSPTGLAVSFNQQSATTLDAILTWTAPSSAGASAITDYTIEYKTAGAPSWTVFAHTASTATTATLNSLVPSTTYDFRVSAKNAVATGPASAVVTATTNGPSSRLACTQPGTSNSSSNSITIIPCAGVAVGNLIMIPVTISNSSPTVVEPISQMAGTSGFTALGTQLNGSNQTTIFYKIADASDVGRSASYGFSWTSNVKNAITLVTYKTTDGLAPQYASTSGTGAIATSPAVTVSDVSDYTLVYVYTMTGVALSSTTPTIGEWSVSTDLWKNTTAGANNAQAAAVTTTDVDKTAAGTTAGRTATTPSMTATTKWNAAVLVLRPAP